MTITFKYFGLIAERIGKSEENISVTFDITINIKLFLENKYPILKNENYKIAINQELNDILSQTNEKIEIALLPPFAGG